MKSWRTRGIGRAYSIGLVGWLLVGLLLAPVDCGRLPRIHSLFEPLPAGASPVETPAPGHAHHHPAEPGAEATSKPDPTGHESPLPTLDLFDHPLVAGFVTGFERPVRLLAGAAPVPASSAAVDGLVAILDPPPPRSPGDRER